MGLPGWNESTGKLLEGPGGLICEGCCFDVGFSCSHCSPYDTPSAITLSISGLTQYDCVAATHFECTDSYEYYNLDTNIVSSINGIHTLNQVGSSLPCRWRKQISVSFDEDRYCWDAGGGVPEDGCDVAGFVTSVSNTYIWLQVDRNSTSLALSIWAPSCPLFDSSVLSPTFTGCISYTGGSVSDSPSILYGASWSVST